MCSRDAIYTGMIVLALAAVVRYVAPFEATVVAAGGSGAVIILVLFLLSILYKKLPPVTQAAITWSVLAILTGFLAWIISFLAFLMLAPHWRHSASASLLIGLAVMLYIVFVSAWTYVLVSINAHKLALQHVNRIIAWQPWYIFPYGLRGYIRLYLHDYAGAIDDYTIALKRSTKPDRIYHYRIGRSWAYIETLAFDRAIVDCNQAIQLSPLGVDSYIQRAAAYIFTERYDLAATDLEHAAGLNNTPFTEAVLYTNRGFLNYALGDEETALADYKLALKIPLSKLEKRQLHPSVYENIGCMFYRRGDFETALTCFQKGEALNPENMPVLAGLAIIFYAVGKRKDALSLWRSLLAREPGFSDGEWVRQKYYRWTTPMADTARQIIADLKNDPAE